MGHCIYACLTSLHALRVERIKRRALDWYAEKGKFLVLGSHTPKQVAPSGDLNSFQFLQWIHKEFAGFRKAATSGLYETSKSAREGARELLRVTQYRLWVTCLKVGRRFLTVWFARGTLRMHKTSRVITADRANDWSFSIRCTRSVRDGAGENRVALLSGISVLFGPFSELPEEWCGA